MARQSLALLAHHEMYVADFYLDRDQPRAAVARLKVVLNSYQGSGVEPEAFLLLGETFLKLRDKKAAYATFQELEQRYPGTEQAFQATSYLQAMKPPAVRTAPTP